MSTGRMRKFFLWFYRNRTLSLTPEGTRFVLLVFAIGLAAVNTGNNLLYLLLAMMLSLIVLSGILSEQSLKHLSIVRRMPEHIFAGQPTTAHFYIGNHKSRFPSFSLHVMDLIDDKPLDRGVYVLHLSPGASTLRPYPLLVPRRGLYRIDGAKLLTRFPFSLFIKGLNLPLESEVVVYPAVKPLPAPLHSDLDAIGYEEQLHRRGQGGDLYNLRPYQPGDDSRAIHWKTTARTDLLIVRESQAEDQQRVTLALPTLPPVGDDGGGQTASVRERFERAVELTASLTVHFHERSYAIRGLVGDRFLDHGSSEDPIHHILRALALCELAPPSDPDSSTTAFADQLGHIAGEELTILVLPWDDPRLEASCAGVNRVFRASELMEATHAG